MDCWGSVAASEFESTPIRVDACCEINSYCVWIYVTRVTDQDSTNVRPVARWLEAFSVQRLLVKCGHTRLRNSLPFYEVPDVQCVLDAGILASGNMILDSTGHATIVYVVSSSNKFH
jgi:hypothetical protein